MNLKQVIGFVVSVLGFAALTAVAGGADVYPAGLSPSAVPVTAHSAIDANILWNGDTAGFGFFTNPSALTYAPVSASVFTSSAAPGTPPLNVISTTKVANLNADMVDGLGFTAPASANGVAYSTDTAAVAFTGAGSPSEVLAVDSSGVPTWRSIGLLELSGTGFVVHTGPDTYVERALTAGDSISITNSNGVAASPVISVGGTTQNAVQVGSSTGSLANVPVGASNTVLCGNTGAAPGFRQIANGDVAAAAGIDISKLAHGTAGQMIVNDASGVPTYRTITGDVEVTSAGAINVSRFQEVRDTGSAYAGYLLGADPSDSTGTVWVQLHPEIMNAQDTDLGQECDRCLFSNWGVEAERTVTLTSNMPGCTHSFIVANALGVKIMAAGTRRLRIAGDLTTATTGYIESTTLGSTITFILANMPGGDLQWVALSHEGTWTVH